MHLYVAGSRVDATATLTSNIAPVSGAVSSLQDDDVLTGARWTPGEGVALTWDFGVGGGVDVDGVRVGSTDAVQSEFPAFLSLWFSDDANTWTRHADWAGDYPGVRQKTAGFYNWQPNDIAVVAQLGFVGASGSTTFTDDVAGNVWTPGGAAQIKTDQFKWGGSSGYFNGTTDYLFMPSRPGLNLGSADFCIEVWFRATSLTNDYGTILANGPATFVQGSRFLMVYGSASAFHPRQIGFGGEGTVYANPLVLSTTLVTVGTWYRVKVVKVGASVYLYVNDVLEATTTGGNQGGGVDFGLSGTYIGRNTWDAAKGYFNGHIGELRITHTVGEEGTLPTYVRHPVPKKTPQSRLFQPDTKIASGVQMWPFTGAAQVPAPAKTRGDYVTGILGTGKGRVKGTTKDKGSPNVAVSERVRLYREQDGLLIRELWSTPGTGAYSFDYVDELQTYTVLSYDHDKNFRAVVADGLTLANGGVELIA